jgi:hypothetical protein
MSDSIRYGEPFYLTTTSDSLAPNTGLSTCQTFVRDPTFLINFINPSSSAADLLKLKFVSEGNKHSEGTPVLRNHDVIISLYDDGSSPENGMEPTHGLFYIGGVSSKYFKFQCNKYVTVHLNQEPNPNIPVGSVAVVNIKDQNNQSSSTEVTYGSVNIIGFGDKYFSYCEDIVNNNDGCVGPAVAWKKNGDGSRLKFILHRFPTDCAELTQTCNNDILCCSFTEGAQESDDIGCFNGKCRFCNYNGAHCDGEMECCSGICGLRDGAKVCKPYLEVGDPCESSSQCGGASDGLVCYDQKCKECLVDTDIPDLKCTCIPTMSTCDPNGSELECCGERECKWDNNAKGYVCKEDLPVVIPLYAWIIIIAVAICLILLFYFLLRMYSGGQKYLKKQKIESGMYQS